MPSADRRSIRSGAHPQRRGTSRLGMKTQARGFLAESKDRATANEKLVSAALSRVA